MPNFRRRLAGFVGVAVAVFATATDGDDRNTRIADYLTGSTFVGRYVDDASPAVPREERYEIATCDPIAEDRFQLSVRIRYGDKDATVPMTVRIPVADRTPVITVDRTWVPGFGTFDARVVIDRRPAGSGEPDRYAGTWSGGGHGGHLFGRIERSAPLSAGGSSPAGDSTGPTPPPDPE